MGIVMDPHMDVLLVLQAHDSADSQARAYYGNDIYMGILSHINFTLSPCILRAFVYALVYVLCDSVDSQEFYKYFKRATDRFIDLGIECAHLPRSLTPLQQQICFMFQNKY